VYLVLFASFTLSAFQNVTVDDAVSTGPVIPQYLPSTSNWNIGNNCSGCSVKPDPSLAFDGTWHDCSYSPTAGVEQAINFNFTGTALYIFFIIANIQIGTSTLTNIEFVLDGVVVSQYTHIPSSTISDYQYNVPVYVNEALTNGEHTMMIQPASLQNNMLMLFDYLIYSTDMSSSASPSAQTTSTSPPLPTSSGTQGTFPRQNTGATVGGTVGGVAALVLMAASLLCYRRYKRSTAGRPPVEDGAVVDPFILSREVAPTSLVGMTSSTGLVGSPFAQPTSKAGPSTTTLQPSVPPAATTASATSSSDARAGNDPLLGEVEVLRSEVARLRNLQHLDRNSVELRSEAPPAYS
ncbi:hypothetical protein J3R83DRAFT_13401, partial [Lanmaoa asiatica]